MMPLSLALVLALSPVQDAATQQRAAARAVFERNIQAIQAKDRDAYLSCYRSSEQLVRVGPDGFQLGYASLAEGTPATGSDEWPESLVARDIQVTWVRPGVVYGTYRYRAHFDGVASQGISGRVFLKGEGGWKIAVTSAFGEQQNSAAPPLALVGATVFDGNGGAPVEDAVVILRDGRIEAFGPRAETPVPDGVEVIDLSGRFLTPGLVDTHVHYSQTGWADGRPDSSDQRAEYPYAAAMTANRRNPGIYHRAFVRSGVTAVFDVGGYPWTRDIGAATELASDAPHVAAAGPLLATVVPAALRLPDQDQLLLMEDEEDVRAMVRSHKQQGSQAIKVWFINRRDVFEENAALVRIAGDEAQKQGLPLIVHATELATAQVAVEAGAQLLVHSVEDRPVSKKFLAAAKAAGTFYCPTVTVRRGYTQLFLRSLDDEVRGQLEHVSESVRKRILATEELPPDQRFPEGARESLERGLVTRFEVMAENIRRVHGAGIPVVMGTDAGNPLTLHGPSVFPEMEAMQRAGLTPLEVLTASTRDAARAMGRGDDLGLIEVGRIADILVLTEDPSNAARSMRSLTHVVRAGTLHEREWIKP
jgi:imidazolonepropionase-like amidohydrolase